MKKKRPIQIIRKDEGGRFAEVDSGVGAPRRKRTVRLRFRSDGIRVDIDARSSAEKRVGKTRDLRHPANEYLRDWMTVHEALAHLQVNKDTIRRYVTAGRIRQCFVYDTEPNRFHVRYEPRDVREVADMLRQREERRKSGNIKKARVLELIERRA